MKKWLKYVDLMGDTIILKPLIQSYSDSLLGLKKLK